MIDEIYINEAVRIRKDYLENLIYIAQEQETIESLTNELKELSDEIENSENKSEKYYKDALVEVDNMITKAIEKIQPYHDKIKELDKTQRKLYTTIKDKYPEITDNELKKIMIPHILELDKKYKAKYGDLI